MLLLILILLALWMLGLLAHVGSLIHVLLVIALVVFIYNQLKGSRL